MNFTFGICVSVGTPLLALKHQFISIYGAKTVGELKYFEIVVAGQLSDECQDFLAHEGREGIPIKYIPYEGPSDKPAHITKKKNLIADIAFFDNLCVMHDYFRLPETFFRFMPAKWDIYSHPITTAEGYRHSDWVINPNKMQRYIDGTPGTAERLMEVAPWENAPKYVCGVPYTEKRLVPIQYVSGGFITCKTQVLRDEPFNEDLYWGDAEDVEWSERVVPKYGLTTSREEPMVEPVKIMKPNKWAVPTIPPDIVEGLLRFYGL